MSHPVAALPPRAAGLLNRRLLLGLPAAGLLVACAMPTWSRTQLDSNWLRVDVQDRDSGETLPVYTAADGQRYVAGRPGARYGVTLRNLRGERILVVMSVDGINVLNGRTAGWDQDGYVLGAHASGQIAGWRKSDREVAAFEFTAPGDSYASRTGRPLDLGVIGFAVFSERRPEPRPMPRPPMVPSPMQKDSAAASEAAPAARAEAPAGPASQPSGSGAANDAAAPSALARRERAPLEEQKLGTGHGQREESIVTHTRFVRARSTPDEVLALRYDSRANLIRMGVIPQPDDRIARPPRPFPQNPQASYVPDPPPRY
ncbi:hypothetical protein WKW79_30360 [Variovorax robiniae]|uniref:Uncharacterized protein n=1 Tax=Variovorax robiniae TaxID=1836199 RepID=A0ABU8XGE2_9BURK